MHATDLWYQMFADRCGPPLKTITTSSGSSGGHASAGRSGSTSLRSLHSWQKAAHRPPAEQQHLRERASTAACTASSCHSRKRLVHVSAGKALGHGLWCLISNFQSSVSQKAGQRTLLSSRAALASLTLLHAQPAAL